MAATASIDAIEWLRNQVESAPDALREMLTQMVNLLMGRSSMSSAGRRTGAPTRQLLPRLAPRAPPAGGKGPHRRRCRSVRARRLDEEG